MFCARELGARSHSGVVAGQERGTYIDPAAGRQTFKDYADTWLASQVHRAGPPRPPLSRATCAGTFSLPSAPARWHRCARRKSKPWVKALTASLGPSTVELVYRYLAAIFRAAVADRVIPTSPCTGVRLPKRERQTVVPLDTGSVGALAAAVPDRYRALVILAAGHQPPPG